jgi:hypothetical protein
MTTIQAGIPINQPGVKPLDMSKLKMFNIAEASEEVYQRYIENSEKVLEARYSQAPDTSNSPAYKPYATVQVNGKTVAEIDNHGFVETSNALSSKLNGKLGEIDQQIGTNGPVLAQARAEIIAKLLGGEVVKSSTALTQSQFDAIPEPRSNVGFEAMKEDRGFEMLQKTKEARTLFLAQQIAQSWS